MQQRHGGFFPAIQTHAGNVGAARTGFWIGGQSRRGVSGMHETVTTSSMFSHSHGGSWKVQLDCWMSTKPSCQHSRYDVRASFFVSAYYWTDFVIQSIKGSDLDVVAPPKCHSFGLAILVNNRDCFNTILTFC